MTQADFIISAVSEQDFPRELSPEIVFAGRSNVGKSSLINRLTENRKLARTSATPGKTRSINFYRVNNAFLFVDLPGYGYAKAGKSDLAQWKKLIERYFHVRRSIVLTVQLVDSRLEPTAQDLQLAEWLDVLGLPQLVVATKVDKLSNNQKVMQLRKISESLPNRNIVMSSAETGVGIRDLWNRIMEAVAIASISKNEKTTDSPVGGSSYA